MSFSNLFSFDSDGKCCEVKERFDVEFIRRDSDPHSCRCVIVFIVCFSARLIGVPLQMFPPQGIVGGIISFPFVKDAPVAKGDKRGSIEAPFLSMQRIGTALIMAATWVLLGPLSSVKNLPQKSTLSD